MENTNLSHISWIKTERYGFPYISGQGQIDITQSLKSDTVRMNFSCSSDS